MTTGNDLQSAPTGLAEPPPPAPSGASGVRSIFSVDVEDWFHILNIPSAPSLSEWDSLPSHVEDHFRRMLAIFREARVKVTCFFLGWVAQKFPALVQEAAADGHEIASHGYSHRMIHVMGERVFFEEAVRSREILEQIAGRRVLGYRSAGFSITADMPWFFERLAEAGYEYDSSLFPSPREYGGIKTDRVGPFGLDAGGRRLVEFPITIKKVLGKSICFFGGGYLRLFPMRLIERMADSVLEEGRPVVFYIHPREIDPDHPRLPMGLLKRFKCYVNLPSVEFKMKRILSRYPLTTFAQFIAEHPDLTRPTAPSNDEPHDHD